MGKKIRETWGSRMGVIMAVAGSAVGGSCILVFSGLAADHAHGECFARKQSVYPGYKGRTTIAFSCFGDFGQDRLAEKKNKGEVRMTPLGWVFFGLSWTCILTLAVFCFMKIFQKKEID